jgi:hypothetical protein
MRKETERQKLINQIINLSSDEFDTKEDYLNLAKLSDHQLRNNLININNYILNQ